MHHAMFLCTFFSLVLNSGRWFAEGCTVGDDVLAAGMATAVSRSCQEENVIVSVLRRAFVALMVLALALGGALVSSLLEGDLAYSAPPKHTTTTLTSSGSPSGLGASVTFTATVVRPGGGTDDPTSGTVTFYDGATALGTGLVNASHQATFDTSSLALGGHSMTAIFEGDAEYASSTSAVFTQVVSLPATTTSIASSLNPSQLGQSVSFTATVSTASGTPTGTIAFMDGPAAIPGCETQPLVAGIATCATSSLSIGSHPITAAYSGDTSYSASTSPALDQVVTPLTTAVALSSDVNPSTFGDLVTYTAVVSAPEGSAPTSGTVTFYDGVDAIGSSPVDASAVASISIDALLAGSHSITAVFDGIATHAGSTSTALDQQVHKADTTTSLTFVANPSPFGDIVTLTATVSPDPGAGTVQFTVDGVDHGAPVAVGPGGVAGGDPIANLAVGDHDIEATFSGSANHNPSTDTLSQTVVAAATTTGLASDVNPSVYGDSVTFTATVTSAAGTPDGTVTFQSDGVTIAGCGTESLDAGVATCTTSALSAGPHSVTADYTGSGSYDASSATPLDQTVALAATITTVDADVNPSDFGDTVTFTATVSGVGGGEVPTGTVQFSLDGTPFGGPVTLAAGSASIVGPALAAGTHDIDASYSGNANYDGSVGTLTQTVARAETATVIDSNLDPSVVGDAVTFTATVSPHPAAGTVQFSVDGVDFGAPVAVGPGGTAASDPIANLGAGDHAIEATFSGSANYQPSSDSLTQTVDKAASTTTLATAPAAPVFGQSLSLTATVEGAAGSGTATGNVQFSVDGATAGGPVALVAGVATTTVPGPAAGTHTITAEYSGSADHDASTASGTVTVAAAEESGYWMVGWDGAVFAFGDVPYLGGTNVGDIVDIEPTPSGDGYWIVAGNGALIRYGDATDYGDGRGRLQAGERVVSMSATPANDGYWLFTNIGRVIQFGAAPHFGDMSAVRLNGPVLGSVATPTGQGYYMVASDGGVFSFGDAQFYGSMGGTRLNAPVMSLVPDDDNVGYWLVARDGGVFSFDAPFWGSMGSTPLNRPVIGMVGFGHGYLMVGEDGGIFNFSDKPFHGSLGSNPHWAPIVAVAAHSAP